MSTEELLLNYLIEHGHTLDTGETRECIWVENEDAIFWDTACGKTFELNDGSPSENGLKFCCFCGKPLKQQPFNEKDFDCAYQI